MCPCYLKLMNKDPFFFFFLGGGREGALSLMNDWMQLLREHVMREELSKVSQKIYLYKLHPYIIMLG